MQMHHTHEKSENKEQIWKDQIPTSDGSGNTWNPGFYYLKIFQIGKAWKKSSNMAKL